MNGLFKFWRVIQKTFFPGLPSFCSFSAHQNYGVRLQYHTLQVHLVHQMQSPSNDDLATRWEFLPWRIPDFSSACEIAQAVWWTSTNNTTALSLTAAYIISFVALTPLPKKGNSLLLCKFAKMYLDPWHYMPLVFRNWSGLRTPPICSKFMPKELGKRCRYASHNQSKTVCSCASKRM